MTQPRDVDTATVIQLLSFLLALLIWLSVLVERPGQATFPVPVQTANVPQGVSAALAGPAPAEVEVTVSGPRILLALLPYRGVTCTLDLRGAPAGAISYVVREGDVTLPEKELKLVRVYPATIPVTLARVTRP